jgi:trans-aconitate methyltransferase
MDTQQAATAFWANHAVDPTWMARYAGSTEQPHRERVVAALRRLMPFSSLWEVGCHCGPMLRAVQAAFPGTLLGGCDVNEGAADAARAWLPSVLTGPFPEVSAEMPDRSVDVVLSCYALAYLSPERIGAALAEAGRLAAKAVVLCEPMNWDGNTDKRESAFGEWRHPYLRTLMGLPGFQGWTATCEELDYPDNYLSGLMVVERP